MEVGGRMPFAVGELAGSMQIYSKSCEIFQSPSGHARPIRSSEVGSLPSRYLSIAIMRA